MNSPQERVMSVDLWFTWRGSANGCMVHMKGFLSRFHSIKCLTSQTYYCMSMWDVQIFLHVFFSQLFFIFSQGLVKWKTNNFWVWETWAQNPSFESTDWCWANYLTLLSSFTHFLIIMMILGFFWGKVK